MNDDEIVFEKDDENVSRDAETDIKKLKEKIKKLEAEKQEYLNGWQKARADFVNLRKKDEEDKKNFVRFASEDLIVDIITVLDSFESAFGNKEAWERVDSNWRVGVEYIYNQLKTVLEQRGLVSISPEIGKPFDVETSEAVKHVETKKEDEDGTVIQVLKQGYKLHDKLIRPAQVIVADFKGI